MAKTFFEVFPNLEISDPIHKLFTQGNGYESNRYICQG